MKITLCGSFSVRKQMVEFKQKLAKLGHEAIVHKWYEDGTMDAFAEQVKKDHAGFKKKHDLIRWYYNAICNSDAVLVLNFDKNGIKNYVGGNTLMEMGFAHVNNKKIFLLNPVPEELSYAAEIKAMVDSILGGDLAKIK